MSNSERNQQGQILGISTIKNIWIDVYKLGMELAESRMVDGRVEGEVTDLNGVC